MDKGQIVDNKGEKKKKQNARRGEEEPAMGSEKKITKKGGTQENKAILNFYGSHGKHGGSTWVAFGGLIRTKDDGLFVYGELLQKKTSEQGKQISEEHVAKLMGLKEGLEIAGKKGISELEVQVDSKTVYDYLVNKDKYHVQGNIIVDCKKRINDKKWNIKHITTKKDVRVNLLANKGHPCISVQDAKMP